MFRKKLPLLLLFFGYAWLAQAVEAPPPADAIALLRKPDTLAQAENQARQLMAAMTPAERFDFVCGTGFGVRAVPRLGIPELRFGDASGGLRITPDPAGKHVTTAFPCTLLLAATWDTNLFRAYGQSIAEEFRADGRHFILGPGMNLYRNSRDGRNFEFLGEDPWLASQVVASYVRGAQSVQVGTTLKHFIGNETENHRRGQNTLVDERTLHEVYLAPFQAGIDAGAWAVMTSYNLVNGEWAGQSKYVATELLRRQLDFQYLIMTDWNSTWFGDRLAASGVDLEEPNGSALKQDRALVNPADIDRMVVSILKTGIASGIYELAAGGHFARPEWRDKYPAHSELAGNINRAGIVLLANNGLLPLSPDFPGKILVTGNAAQLQELAGGGSGHVVGYDLNTYWQAAQKTFGTNRLVYAENPTDDEIRSAGVVLLFTGRLPSGHGYEGEASNHTFELPEDALIRRCTALNQRTVVNLVCGGGAAMDWTDSAGAIVLAFFGGQTGPAALMDVLTGRVNPSGKLPFTIERRFEDSCVADDDQQVKHGKVLVDPKELAQRAGVTRWSDFVAERGSDQFRTYDLEYKEGVFVGYRWYDSRKLSPRFPFGFGLSYTTFAYSDLRLATQTQGGEPAVMITFKLTNTGARPGDEIPQVYVGLPADEVPQPVKELKGFTRVHLAPGESRDVTISLGSGAFLFWHPQQKHWVTVKGSCTIQVGASSRDLRLTGRISPWH